MAVIRIRRRSLAVALGLLVLLVACWPMAASEIAVLADGDSILIQRVPVADKLVALTFDDGPDPEFTQPMLDALHAYDAKATFFVLGIQIEQHPELLLATAKAGHEIASHGVSHRIVSRISADEIERELVATEAAIKKITGTQPACYRPPCGIYNSTAVRLLRERSYWLVLWDIDTRDWERPGANVIAQRVLDAVRPGSVILMHDGGSDRTQTVVAVRKILSILSKQGYQFVTVSDLIRARTVDEPAR